MLQLFFWNKHCVCFGKQQGEGACKAVQQSKIPDFENVKNKNKLKNKKLWIFQFNKNNSTSISPQHTTTLYPHHIFKKLIIEKYKTIILNLRRLTEMPPVFFFRLLLFVVCFCS